MVMEGGDKTPEKPLETSDIPGNPPQDAAAEAPKLEIMGSERPSPGKVEELKKSIRERRIENIARFRWKKGRSGNPTGLVGQIPVEVRELCRQYTTEAVAGVVNIMRTTKDERTRFECYRWLCDRGWGKAPQLVGIVTPQDKPVVFTVNIGEAGPDGESDGDG